MVALASLDEPFPHGRDGTIALAAGDGIFRLRNGELIFDYRDLSGRPQRRWRREQIAAVRVDPLPQDRAILVLEFSDGSTLHFTRTARRNATHEATRLRQMLGFEVVPLTPVEPLRKSPPRVKVVSDASGTSITPKGALNPQALGIIFVCTIIGAVALFVAVSSVSGILTGPKPPWALLPFTVIPLLGFFFAATFVVRAIRHIGARVQLQVRDGELRQLVTKRGRVVETKSWRVSEITGVNKHLVARGRGGPSYAIQLHLAGRKPELILQDMNEQELDEIERALHAALKMPSRESLAADWLDRGRDLSGDDGKVLPYQPEASEDQVVVHTPGRLRVLIPPLRPADLPGQSGFAAICTIFVIGIAVNFGLILYHIYLPALIVISLIALTIVAFIVNQLLSHTTLDVDARELTRDKRTPLLGRRTSRFETASIREVMVRTNPARIAIRLEEHDMTLVYMRSQEAAEEIAAKLRAALGLARES